jgi:hypothetical protein
MDAKATAAKVPAAASALLQKRLTKVPKREPILARLQEGYWVVSEQHTAEERSTLAREAHWGLEQMKDELEMAGSSVEIYPEQSQGNS